MADALLQVRPLHDIPRVAAKNVTIKRVDTMAVYVYSYRLSINLYPNMLAIA
jgi:hypothetical protein